MEENKYEYKAINELLISSDNISLYLKNKFPSSDEKKLIHLCIYQVVPGNYNPFLTFLLQKNITQDITTVSFPSMPLTNSMIFENDCFLGNTIEYIQLLLMTKFIDVNEEDIIINGLCEHDSIPYVFIDITKCKIDIYDIYAKNHLWFCLIDEIVNTGYICNIKINSIVSDFFIENKDFMFLHDTETDEKYEIPMVAYVGRDISKLNFTYIFGVAKADNQSIMGPYYYFTNYKNAMIQSSTLINENGQCKKGGVIRFAIFLGKFSLKLNNIEDDIDTSETKMERLTDTKLSQLYEQLTNRISDHNGTWNEDYDSVYLPNIVLDNGEHLKESMTYVLKNYNQQHSLSYHYTDMKSLETYKYSIM